MKKIKKTKHDDLICFLYVLMRDEVTSGVIEGIIQKHVETSHGKKRQASQRNYYLANKLKIRQKRKLDYQENYRKHKNWAIKAKFGMSIQEYEVLLLSQEHRCAICGINQLTSQRHFAVDHNHATGQVRGLLCSQCNTALGLFKEDISVLQRATTYLRKKRKV